MKYGAVYPGRDTFTSPPSSIKALIAISKCRVRPDAEYNQLLHGERERWRKRETENELWLLRFGWSFQRVIRSCKFTVFVLCVIETKPRAGCQSSILRELLESIPLLTESDPRWKVKESTNYTWKDKRLAHVFSLSSFRAPSVFSRFFCLISH